MSSSSKRIVFRQRRSETGPADIAGLQTERYRVGACTGCVRAIVFGSASAVFKDATMANLWRLRAGATIWPNGDSEDSGQ
jgi:hypothetical protein